MMAQSLRLVLFLLFSITVGVQTKKNSSTVEYWVRPDAMLECPQYIPQHQCVTITDLVSHSNNSSLNHGRNISIYLLPGEHVPRESGHILIENSSTSNDSVIAKIIGRGDDSTIKCNLSRIVFVFYRIFQTELRGVSVKNCGQKIGLSLIVHDDDIVDTEFNFTEYTALLHKKAASLAIIGEVLTQKYLLISEVMIADSSGFGLLVVQYRTNAYFKVHITNSFIDSSNVCKPKTVHTRSHGGNVFILVSVKYLDMDVLNLTVANSCKSCFDEYKPPVLVRPVFENSESVLEHGHDNFCGGLRIVTSVIEMFPRVRIQNSTFERNEGVSGGGLEHYLTTADTDSHNCENLLLLEIRNSVFVDNKAAQGGGGIDLALDTEFMPCDPSVRIVSTLFKRNFAETSGGAINIAIIGNSGDYNHYLIEKCVFHNNTARHVGAAVCYTDQTRSGILTLSLCVLTAQSSEGGSVIGLLYANEIYLESTIITDNNCTALYMLKSNVYMSGTVYITNNYAIRSNGGGIRITCGSRWDYPLKENRLEIADDSHLYMLNNRADGKGGGMYISTECKYIQTGCTIMAVAVKQPVITMINNTAIVAGDSIFGGNLDGCILNTFWKIFKIKEKNSFGTISSSPRSVCVCSPDFPQTHNCTRSHDVTIFRGQIFKVPMLCVGQFDYSSPCTIQAITTTNGVTITDESKVHEAKNECKNFSYGIQIHLPDITALTLQINPDSNENNEYPILWPNLYIYVGIKDCPLGFTEELSSNNNSIACNCSKHIQQEGVICDINVMSFYKPAQMWIGNYSEDLTTHRNCPFDYCEGSTALNPNSQEDQCALNRAGVLCGACRPGLSLVLGTSRCIQCSNYYLFLLLPFALAGVVLVFFLLISNLTVSTGTINGLIFFANIVQAAKTAFFPIAKGQTNIFVRIFSVFVAWLNLDIGIETCFANGLNTYSKTWLQFVFPLYIWSLVGLLILISRYSVRVSRWTGSNTVSVLATLFLLTYAKLLRVTFDIFSSTSLTGANGTTSPIWLLDGNYEFLQWPHSLLFTAALVTLLAHILPFTVLLLVAPTLQRCTHHKSLRWVNRLKPFLDTYQGPYKTKVRYWPGLLLLIRMIILSAISLNVTGNRIVNLFCIATVITIKLLYMWLKIGKLYTSTIPHLLEVFFIGNLQIFTLASLLLLSVNDWHYAQETLVYCTVGSSLLVFMLIVIYHGYKFIVKRSNIYRRFVSQLKKPKRSSLDDGVIDMYSAARSSTPTTTTVDLQELLLEEH